jgi:hypothetical protein
MSSTSHNLNDQLLQELRDASAKADVERLRAIYAEHGALIRDGLDGSTIRDTPEEMVLEGVLKGLQEIINPNHHHNIDMTNRSYLDLLTVFFRELGGRSELAPRKTVFGVLIKIDADNKYYRETIEASAHWFESMRRVVTHLVEGCGLRMIGNEEAPPTWRFDLTPQLLMDLAMDYMAWASVFAFAQYLPFPTAPLERFIRVQQRRRWLIESEYIMQRLLRMTSDDELGAVMQAHADDADDNDYFIHKHMEADVKHRKHAAREMALRTGTMGAGWGRVVMRETILGDMIMDLAFGRPPLIP